MGSHHHVTDWFTFVHFLVLFFRPSTRNPYAPGWQLRPKDEGRELTTVQKLSSGKKKLVTFLALAGFIQPMMLLGFYVTYNAFVVHIDSFPSYPSYLRNEICGEGTQYACPNKEWVPIPSRGTKLHIAPDDPRLPQKIRDMQGISAAGKDPYARD